MMIMSFLQYADGASGLEQNSLYEFLFYLHFIVLWLFAVCLYLQVCSVVIFTAQCTLVQMRGLGIACRPFVCPSVRLSVCDVGGL